MIGYTCVGTNDLEKAVKFYSELLSLLDAKPFFTMDRGTGWGVSPDKPMFSVLKPFNGEAATVGNGTMIGLVVNSKDLVNAMHAKALTLGGTDEGAPGLRFDGFYAGYFRDLDGNKLAVYCTGAAAA